MNDLTPINQTKLFGLNKYINELISLNNSKILPNKILLSGPKGQGKSTLAYHFINYCLSKNEEFNYNTNTFEINSKNRSFKTIINKSNPNFILIDINLDKKFIEIDQIRDLIINLNKSTFNNKSRFVLIDNIEYLNTNSINALLKILEEPSYNTFFLLINNNKKIFKTLSSRCLNFKITLSSNKCLQISNELLNRNLYDIINPELINYYVTPGIIFNLANFAIINKLNLKNVSLEDFLKNMIKDQYYKKDDFIKNIIFDFIEFYFRKINLPFSDHLYEKYSYFIKKISNTKKFNLDEESLFAEFNNEILNG